MRIKQSAIWIIGVVMMALLLASNADMGASSPEMKFSAFMRHVEDRNVQSVVIDGRNVQGVLNDGQKFSVNPPHYPQLVEKLIASGAEIETKQASAAQSWLSSLLFALLPVVALVALWMWAFRHMQGGGKGGAMGFGKSRAKMMQKDDPQVTFKDVAGIDEAIEELEEIVDFLKDPGKFQKLGGKIPKGVLLVGPPGTGKTLLARAIAGEASVPFFSISGSDFVEMFVGVGASRVRDMFEQGRKSAPCIIFIDEIDAVGRHRGGGWGGGNDEREQTLNQLLVEMDGFGAQEGIIIIAATNRVDVLDKALLRPGRFDRQVIVDNPDIAGRAQILNIHMREVPVAPDVDAEVIARGTPGFSGADLANLVNEAALLAARRDQKVVTMREMEEAKDKVMMGAERKSRVLRDEEKELTAYHEAGHAIVGLNLENADPIHKATIIPRGQALGMVMQLPEHDHHTHSKGWLKARIAVAMGGRVAEEIIFGAENVTSGASSDIQHATQIATSMVRFFGLSDRVGKIAHEDTRFESDETTKMIDEEVRKLVDEGYEEARRILTEKGDDFRALGKALLEYETLSGEEIKDLLDGKDIRPVFSKKDEAGEGGKRTKSSLPSGGKRRNKEGAEDDETKNPQ